LAKPGYLLDFSVGIRRWHIVVRFQCANHLRATEPLGQHMDDRRIDIVDTVSQVLEAWQGAPIEIRHRSLFLYHPSPASVINLGPLCRHVWVQPGVNFWTSPPGRWQGLDCTTMSSRPRRVTVEIKQRACQDCAAGRYRPHDMQRAGQHASRREWGT
jgi:hypothetical protein